MRTGDEGTTDGLSEALDGVVLLSCSNADRWRTKLDANCLDQRTEAARNILQQYVDRRSRYEAGKS